MSPRGDILGGVEIALPGVKKLCNVFTRCYIGGMKLPRPHHMPPEKLAGQLLMPVLFATRANRSSPRMQKIIRLMRRHHIGGFIFFRGTPEDARNWRHFLDRESEWPLLIASDLERGLGSVFRGGTHFPHPMMLGAGRDANLARECGRIFGREAQAAGINVIFGPCFDLGDNPKNPIVNIRTFGADPALVSELGVALMSGIQDAGVAAVGKHFPGHGATALDSHTELPVIEKPLSELKKTELHPFRAAVDAGIKGIMTGHLAVGKNRHPATLEARVTRAILREQWRYKGVVFSDALDMAAITTHYSAAEQAFLPIEAGLDVLLMPNRVPLIHRLLSERIASDPDFRTLTEASVERIFQLKRWLHQQQPKQAHPFRIAKTVEHPNHIGLANKVAEKGISLISKSARFPIDWRAITDVHHLIHTDSIVQGQALENFCGALKQQFDSVSIHNNPAADLTFKVSRSSKPLFVISLYVRTFEHNLQKLNWSVIKPQLKALADSGHPLVVFLFGNPHRINNFPANIKADAIFLVPSYIAAAQLAAAKALCSTMPITGQLPVPLKRKTYQSIQIPASSYNLVPASIEGDWSPLDKLVEDAIHQRYFPGCATAVAQKGKIILSRGYGRFDYSDEAKTVQPDTNFGLASLTKVLAATPAVMKLLESGDIRLEERLASFYPQLGRKAKANITIADLLAHQSGFPAWKPFYKDARTADDMIEAVLATPLAYKTGTKAIYSDLGFILLFDIVEKITGVPFDSFCRDQLYRPMGLKSLHFNPGADQKYAIPPLGTDDLRKEIIRAEVNDTNCHAMGGVSGHAGLFGHALDVAAFGQLFLNKGIYNGQRHFRTATVETFSKIYDKKISARALGWDTPTPPSSSGRHFSKRTIGHLGFTGTSLWIDLQREIIVVLLTNRVHPDKEVNHMKAFRPQFHDAVMKLIKARS